MPSSQLRKIASHYLLTPQGFYKHPLITVDALSGEIFNLESYSNNLDATAGVEFYSGILCPGFTNAHCHSELSYLKDTIAEGVGYAGFAAAMAGVRDNFTPEQRAAALKEADRYMWNEGINIVADIVNDNSSFATKADSPIKYHSFAEVFGLKKSNLEYCKSLTANPNTTLTPHSVYSVQSRDFSAVCNNGSSPLSIHFKESEAEQLLFEGKGSLAEWYSAVGFECDFLHFGSPARRIVESIPADRSVLLVHNCFVTQQDIDLIMSHFTAPVYWVLCPRSNRYISGQTPDVVQLLSKNGLNICIGTDSLASNHSLSILEELKCFDNIPLDQLLTWATYNGAAALGEKTCGIINICGADLEAMKLTPKTTVKRVL